MSHYDEEIERYERNQGEITGWYKKNPSGVYVDSPPPSYSSNVSDKEMTAVEAGIKAKRCTRNMPIEWPTEERIDIIAHNGATGEHYMKKYDRALRDGTTVDVYDVLDAFPSNCPPIDHAIKKLLCTGARGAKDWETDLQEAIDSLEQAKKYPPVPF